MASPFPGMDPYIEAAGFWGDFHNNLIAELQRELVARLPRERYAVRTEERAYIVSYLPEEDEDEDKKQVIPDMGVVVRDSGGSVALLDARTSAIEDEIQPVEIDALIEEEVTETFLEVRELAHDRPLVTRIEVLSQTNKRSGTTGWTQYLNKRGPMLSGIAHFVEIDLLRRGRRMPMQHDWPDSPYYILTCRRERAPTCSVWPAYSLRPLPPVTIPLLNPDGEIKVDLNPIVAAVAELGNYEIDIDYTQPIRPPLADDERAWLDARLAERSA